MKALSNNGLVVHLHGAKIPSLFIKDFKCNSDVSFDPDYILTLIMSNGWPRTIYIIPDQVPPTISLVLYIKLSTNELMYNE